MRKKILPFAPTQRAQRRVLTELELKKCFAFRTAFCKVYAVLWLVNKWRFELFNSNMAPKKRQNEKKKLLSFARTQRAQRRVLTELELKTCFAFRSAFCKIYAVFCLVNMRRFELFNSNMAQKKRQSEKKKLLSFARTQKAQLMST